LLLAIPALGVAAGLLVLSGCGGKGETPKVKDNAPKLEIKKPAGGPAGDKKSPPAPE
jgi:hypothetical protein